MLSNIPNNMNTFEKNEIKLAAWILLGELEKMLTGDRWVAIKGPKIYINEKFFPGSKFISINNKKKKKINSSFSYMLKVADNI